MVVLKLGRSMFGQRATLAHTGTLAGRHEAFAALFHQNGVALVDSIDALVETAGAPRIGAAAQRRSASPMMTVSGGATSLIGDLGEAAGIRFPAIGEATNRRLQQILGVERHFGNPIDTVGMPRLRGDGNMTAVLHALLEDDAIDVIGLVLGMRAEGAEFTRGRWSIGMAAAMHARQRKPLMRRLLHVEQPDLAVARLSRRNKRLPLIEDLGARPAGGAPSRRLRRASAAASPHAPSRFSSPPRRVDVAGASGGDDADRSREQEDSRLRRPAGDAGKRWRAPRQRPCAIAAEIGGPVALKIQSPDIPHKSDVGGVHLGAAHARRSRSRRRGGCSRMRERNCPHAAIDGMLVQEMVEDGVEFILGMTYDEQFGPLIVCGAGGRDSRSLQGCRGAAAAARARRSVAACSAG